MDYGDKKSSDFENLMTYLKRMNNRYFYALYAFYAYKTLRESTDSDIVGESKAKENLQIIERFSSFFLTTQEALRLAFFLELAKLFDASSDSLHINKVINFTEANLKSLTIEAFKEYNKDQDRVFLEHLVKEYQGIIYSDLIKTREMLDRHEVIIKKLKDYRDQWLAHDQKNKPEIPDIKKEEIKTLFDVLADILNLFTSKLNHESTIWDHIQRDVENDTQLVVEYLGRFEPYRLEEIERDFS